MARVLSKTYSCPTAFTLSVLGSKWKTVVLSYLKEREEDGLIARQVVEASDAQDADGPYCLGVSETGTPKTWSNSQLKLKV